MSSKLKRLSGKEVVSILNKFGFAFLTQRGSHIKLRRIGSAGDKQTLTDPSHDELDAGTLRAIIRQACRYVPEEYLKPYFYGC